MASRFARSRLLGQAVTDSMLDLRPGAVAGQLSPSHSLGTRGPALFPCPPGGTGRFRREFVAPFAKEGLICASR